MKNQKELERKSEKKSQKECQKCIFQQSGDLNFKNSELNKQ